MKTETDKEMERELDFMAVYVSFQFVLCLWISRNGSSEQQNMRFWHVLHVVNPATRLLHTNRSPFFLAHQMFGQIADELFGQHNVPVRETKHKKRV